MSSIMPRKLVVTLCSLLVVAAMGVGALLISLLSDLPQLSGMHDYRPPVISKVYDRNGELIARFFKQRRTVVPREQMPDRLVKAFLAAEDADFYEHSGVDLSGLLAAVLTEIKHQLLGSARRGGSTITQQTAKTFLLTPEQTYDRKIKEMVLAWKIEQAFTKDEILFLYLNQIYFGNGAYGVEEAAQTYFGKHVGELTLAECAVLASIPKSPNRINPIYNPNRTLERRAYVLQQMEKRGFAPPDEVAEAMKAPLLRERPPAEYLNRTPYYAEDIRQHLIGKYGEEMVYQQGLVAYAAVDARMDVAAHRALRQGLAEADKRMGYRGPLMRLDADVRRNFLTAVQQEMEDRLPRDPVERAQLVWDLSRVDPKVAERSPQEAAEQVRLAHKDPGSLVGVVVVKVDSAADTVTVDLGTTRGTMEFSTMKWARANRYGDLGPTPRDPADVLQEGDVVLVRLLEDKASKGAATGLLVALEQYPRVQGAVVAVEPETRRVRAMVGGWDFARSSFDRATMARRQPGSAFKPFIYAAAIQSRVVTPASILVDAPKVFADKGAGRDWKPENSDGRFRGDIRLRECLTHSVNICSITLVESLTPEKVVELATRVGLGEKWPMNLTLALGTGEVTPLKLANAYATFADEGRYGEPVIVEKVKTVDGTVLEEADVRKVDVLDPATAYVTLSMMQSVVESGTAWRIKELGRPVAGKTGTTNDARDAWFVGCVPGLCTAVYVGMDNHEPMGPQEAGGRAAAPVFLEFYRTILQGAPIREFPVPEGVEHHEVDPRTGLLAAEGQTDALREVFISGTAPTERAVPAEDRPPDDWREGDL
ncbi:MAG: PBP1A family penicillin-binding protein [Myxococcota bacterium]